MNDTQTSIVKDVRAHPGTTAIEVSQRLFLSEKTLQFSMTRLANNGYLQRVRDGRSYRYTASRHCPYCGQSQNQLYDGLMLRISELEATVKQLKTVKSVERIIALEAQVNGLQSAGKAVQLLRNVLAEVRI